MSAAAPRAVLLKDYQPPPFLVESVDLRFELDPQATRVTSRLQLRRNPRFGTAPTDLVLDGRQLELQGLRLDGAELPVHAYACDSESLTLFAPPPAFQLEIDTVIHPESNTALEGLYLSSGILCTQCEAQGFRKITYYPDRPDVLARFSTTLVADRSRFPILLANGNRVEQGDLGGGRHFARWDDPFPKPCYLFAAVAGDLVCIGDRFTTASGRAVTLEIYVEERNRHKCDHALASLQRAMRWDEETFGLEYDLDRYMILAVDDFNFGAMENKGLNIFNSKYVLASPETATDADYQAIEEVVGHEYFHNWTGNRVTCRDWFQLSLKEGLTVFRDQEFSAEMTSRPVKRISDVRLLRSGQFPEDAGPLAHPVRPPSYVEINNFYTATVYNKGAEVIRMYQTLLGREGFARGLKLYLQRHDGQAATTDDFLAAMADANGADLEQFRLWYSQAGTPRLQVCQSYDAATGELALKITQQCPPTPGQSVKKPFHIPLSVALLADNGHELPLQLAGEPIPGPPNRVLSVRRAEETFRFVGLRQRPTPSLLRNFSAPVRLEIDHSEADLAFLFARDSDPFNRWDAGQQLACRLLLGLADDLAAQRPPRSCDFFVSACRQLLLDDGADPAFRALALTLPAEGYLAELVEVVDPQALHAARELLRGSIATTCADELLETYRSLTVSGPYLPDAPSCGRRSLRNLALTYLTAVGTPQALELAAAQYRHGGNMTDVLAALAALSQQPGTATSEAFTDFYQRWQSEPLVIDKWFTLQAMSCHADTLDVVSKLLAHPAFTYRNPNRVRALLGAFAQSNPGAFHRDDGAGYRLLGSEILHIDPLNPQLATRLAGALSRWRRYRAPLRDAMRHELERLAGTSLSRDLYEVVTKSLEGE